MAPDRPWVCLAGIVPSCPNPSQPDRIGSKFLPSEELFIGPQSNGIWRQKRDEGILGKPAPPPPSHTGFLFFVQPLIFKKVQMHFPICELAFARVFSGPPSGVFWCLRVSAHMNLRDRIPSAAAEKCGISVLGRAVNTWFGDLCGLYLGSGLIFVAVFHLAAGHKVATCPFRCLRLGILSNNHRSPSRPPWIFRIRQKVSWNIGNNHEIFRIRQKVS